MDDLFGRLVADLGVDRAATEMAVGILLRFQKERPAEKVLRHSSNTRPASAWGCRCQIRVQVRQRGPGRAVVAWAPRQQERSG